MDASADNPGDNEASDINIADGAGDTNDWAWLGERVVPTIVVTEPEVKPEMKVGTRSRGGGEYAIGATFAIGAAA